MKSKDRITKNIARAKSKERGGGNSGIFSNSGYGQKNDKALAGKADNPAATYAKTVGAQKELLAGVKKAILINQMVKKETK